MNLTFYVLVFTLGVVLGSKPHQSCLRSLKGKLCLKLSIRNYDGCMANALEVADRKKEVCVAGREICVFKPRVCSGSL